ncbi:hypothetical protein D3C81_1242730 [compost metagenome]
MNQQALPTHHDPVHMDPDGSWWFYDETGAGRYGPYADDTTARSMLGQYIAWLNQQQGHEVEQAAQQQAMQQGQPSELDVVVAEYLRLRDIKVEIAEDEAFDIQRQAQGGQQAVQQPAPQQQAPVQQAAPVEQQQAPAATGWGNPAPAQQAQQQAPAFDPNNPFAGAPGAQQQQTGAPNQPGVVASGDLNAAFAGWDDGAQH